MSINYCKHIPASHAHTLLLDLEQLEVMANLKDKINIDSSSSSCNAKIVQTLPPLTSSTITNATMAINNNYNNTCNATNYPTNTTTTTTNQNGDRSLLDEMNLFCTTTKTNTDTTTPNPP